MRARWLVAAIACAGIGCDAIYGIQQLPGDGVGNGGDAGTGKDASVSDGSNGRDGTTGADGPAGDDGGGFVDVKLTCPFDGAAGANPALEWAEWKMPNAPTDVEAGAPNPEHYTDNGDGTVTDEVTGLVWEQGSVTDGAGVIDIGPTPGALTLCAKLSLAGHCDWRLPSYVELWSLVDVSQQPPPIDAHYFPDTPIVAFWSSTPVAGTSFGEYWDVYFGSNPRSETATASGLHHARCVRGGAASDAGAPPGRYAVASGTVTDLATGLVWQQRPVSGTSTWSTAHGICAGLSLGGLAWRLPTVDELVTIVDVTQAAPAIDTSVFSAVSSVFWTASPVAGSTVWAWGVDFDQGTTSSTVPVTSSSTVRCVNP